MIRHKTNLRVRYSETDRMGYVYYGNYPQYYEVGRVETLRQFDAPYKALEDSGVLLPVADLHIRYARPAYYDDLLTVETIIPELPDVRFPFQYNIYNEQGTLINEGYTTLVFVDKATMRPCKIPDFLRKKLEPHF